MWQRLWSSQAGSDPLLIEDHRKPSNPDETQRAEGPQASLAEGSTKAEGAGFQRVQVSRILLRSPDDRPHKSLSSCILA
jgi:hypothetical protein